VGRVLRCSGSSVRPSKKFFGGDRSGVLRAGRIGYTPATKCCTDNVISGRRYLFPESHSLLKGGFRRLSVLQNNDKTHNVFTVYSMRHSINFNKALNSVIQFIQSLFNSAFKTYP
jgi:hypothetical protein